MIIRMAVLLLSFGFYASGCLAQKSIPERLNQILETLDPEAGFKFYHDISEEDLKSFPDSILFDYHFLGGWLHHEIDWHKDHHKAIYHLLEAKRLCDTSLGTHSGTYMEVMHGLGDEYIELGNYEEALAIFQEGIVKSTYMRSSASQDFGNLIIGVQECYEHMGWYNEVPRHLMDAWSFWNKDAKPLETYTYYPLWCLHQFYRRYAMYDKAIQVSDEIIKFITEKEDSNYPLLAEELYIRGNTLADMGKLDEAIKTYRQGLSILKSNKLETDETYSAIACNMLKPLIFVGNDVEFEKILNEIKVYSSKINDVHPYFASLFGSAKFYFENGNVNKALAINERATQLSINDDDIVLLDDQRKAFLCAKQLIDDFNITLEKFNSLPEYSYDWFEAGIKLSNAYFLKKDVLSDIDILNKLYEGIRIAPSIGKDYQYSVLNSLFTLNYSNADYYAALKYAHEIKDFVNNHPDAREYDYLGAYSNIVCAKIKCNSIDDIDSDLDKIQKYTNLIFGENSTQYASYLNNRGRAYQLQGKLDDAKEFYLKAIALNTKIKGSPDSGTVQYLLETNEQIANAELDL